ncbi:MAG: peptidylprolyl isomerase [Bacteroidales bacterium]|jgi:cyclophilin family peptidyl-prolyl cis-trans isomerase|nr:peptidylprolyl isomerase [Bacteroidales bacterium]
MKKTLKLSILFLALLTQSCNMPASNNSSDVHVQIKTSMGDITVRLYNETPLHKNNFIKLVNSGFYDGVTFHRVINGFMIQAGNPATKPDAGALPDSLNLYTIPAELNSAFYHKKGALAAARQGNEINPYMRSSGTQFYIVQGTPLTEQELNLAEQQINSQIKQTRFRILLKETADSAKAAGSSLTDAEIQDAASLKMFQYLSSTPDFKLTPEQRNIYTTVGGTPRLDGTYTVFGTLSLDMTATWQRGGHLPPQI